MSKQMVQWSFRSMIILMALTSMACSRGGSGSGNSRSRVNSAGQQRVSANGQSGVPQRGTYVPPMGNNGPGVKRGGSQPPQMLPATPPTSAPAQTIQSNNVSNTVGVQKPQALPNFTIGTDRGSVSTTSRNSTAPVAVSSGPSSSGDAVVIIDRSGSVGSTAASTTVVRSLDDAPWAGGPQRRDSVVVAHPSTPSPDAHVAPREVVYNSNAGPGGPAGDITSATPKITGLPDESGRGFTDSKDDAVMAAMMNKMAQMSPQNRKDSEDMAQAVRNVWLANNRGQLNLSIALDEGGTVTEGVLSNGQVLTGKKMIHLNFTGQLNGKRQAELAVLNNNSEFQFRATVTCVDADNNCRNTVIMVEHLQQGQLCRRIYIVHRWYMDGVGDGHFTLSDDDHYNWEKRSNPQQRGFLQLISNTVTWNKNLFERRNDPIRGPLLKFIGIRSWAVALGTSEAEVIMSKNKNDGYTAKFVGPLVMGQLQGEPTKMVVVMSNISDATQNAQINESLSGASASLVDNDGRGNLVLEVRFSATEASRVTFTGLGVPTLQRRILDQLIP